MGMGKEKNTYVRYGITSQEEVNPNVRYQLEGGAGMSKEVALESCAAKVAAKVLDRHTERRNKFHLVLFLTKNDLDACRVALEDKGVAANDIIINTADTRSKGGREHRDQVGNWKKAGSGAPLVMLSTQPVAGINHTRLLGMDMFGSFNVVSTYQGLQRICRSISGQEPVMGLGRIWQWSDMFDHFKSGEGGGERLITPQGLQGVKEITPESYLKLFEGDCVKDVLCDGRSPGGVRCCPSGGFDEKERLGKDLPLLCSVCDEDRRDYKKHFEGEGGGHGREEEEDGGEGGDQGCNDPLTIQRRSQEVINAGSRQVVGNTESTGEERRFWTDSQTDMDIGLNKWRCGEIMKDPRSGRAMIDEDDKEVKRGGCGSINQNWGWNNFMCRGCKKGKSGWKQGAGATDSNRNSSFSCDCGKYTFHRPSEETRMCYACKEERGAWHSVYGYNRGVIKNPRTETMDVYLGFFGEPGNEVEKWKNESNFTRRKKS
ncbi:hypothetical protein TrRE_jg8675 [Triparma retinervis]|uniref:Uncharacterized protein n=1 Tax=Triparma retinervis TaxID=2557542 RepID=A0A9W6ZTK3_9STRA|nr:hypothetical protein TrRE_jg8675 [Triparma retinervis]